MLFPYELSFSFISIFVVIFYAAWYENDHTLKPPLFSEASRFFTNLFHLENKYNGLSKTRKPKIAVGFESCVDVSLRAVDFFDHFAQSINISDLQPHHHSKFTEKRHIIETFLYFFKEGAAVERFIDDEKLFEQVLNTHAFVPSVSLLGGSATMMAKRFGLENGDVLLGAKISPLFEDFLPAGVKIVSVENATVERDDIHSTIEYSVGDTIGQHTAPRANRLIIHHDKTNPYLSSFPALNDALSGFNPDLLLVGGLQMMDRFPFKSISQRDSRIDDIRDMLNQVEDEFSRQTLTHFELASYSDTELMVQLYSKIGCNVKSLGMNEQELANLNSFVLTGKIKLIDNAKVSLQSAYDHSLNVINHISSASTTFRLRRLHVHTLKFQLNIQFASRVDEPSDSVWPPHPDIAVARASLMATMYICALPWPPDQDVIAAAISRGHIAIKPVAEDQSANEPDLVLAHVTTKSEKKRIALTPDQPMLCWFEKTIDVLPHFAKSEDGKDKPLPAELTYLHICVAAVAECIDVQRTTGGGDNITPVGLSSQLIK